jgi:hypothetical protein
MMSILTNKGPALEAAWQMLQQPEPPVLSAKTHSVRSMAPGISFVVLVRGCSCAGAGACVWHWASVVQPSLCSQLLSNYRCHRPSCTRWSAGDACCRLSRLQVEGLGKAFLPLQQLPLQLRLELGLRLVAIADEVLEAPLQALASEQPEAAVDRLRKMAREPLVHTHLQVRAARALAWQGLCKCARAAAQLQRGAACTCPLRHPAACERCGRALRRCA